MASGNQSPAGGSQGGVDEPVGVVVEADRAVGRAGGPDGSSICAP